MKRLLLPLIAALALPTAVEANWFGKYGSYREAQEACFEWKNKKGKFKYWFKDVHNMWGGDRISERDIRKCDYEEQTRQFLGLEYPNINVNDFPYEDDEYTKIIGSEVIKKRFKY